MSGKQKNERDDAEAAENPDVPAGPGAGLGAAPVAPFDLDGALMVALGRHRAGRLDEAQALYRGVLKVEPDHADALHLLGVLHAQSGDEAGAAGLIERAIGVNPDNAAFHFNLANVYKTLGRLTDAIAAYRRALAVDPDHHEAHNNLGAALKEAGDVDEAAGSYRRALAIEPNNVEAHVNLGDLLQAQGRLDDAVGSYRRALAINPNDHEVHNHLGTALKDQGKLDEAVAAYRRALAIAPRFAEAHGNLGNALRAQGKPDQAVASHRRALAIAPDDAAAHFNLGNVLKDQGELDEAVGAYRRALELAPENGEAHYNLGNALQARGELDDAVGSYRRALAVDPKFAAAHNNLGNALKALGRLDAAVACYRRALELRPESADMHNNLGRALEDMGKLDEAAAAHRRAIAIDPDNAPAQAGLVALLQYMCDWKNLEPAAARLDELIDSALCEDIEPAEAAFMNVARCEDASRNLEIAQAWSADIARRMAALEHRLPFEFERSPEGKIRIGYLSADFRAHATSYLMVSLFALHDREAFEIHAYSYGPDGSSDYRKRIANDCDTFVDIRDRSAVDAARRIHEDGIDILVDLKGYTKGARPEICALRPAPVQATYLGFPGSTGAGFFDYILTDRIVTPEDQAAYYTEKFVYLPHCYQVNDHTKAISDKPFTRADFGLPEEGFVFCCFNQTYKIEPVMWEVWMRVLRSIPGSVLWLYGSNGAAERNLKPEAAAQNVDPERIVFAKMLPMAEHLARIRLADLFLDTRVFNGHTTASDALWAGVPLITLQGRHFASRVASSLLTAMGLPELITHSLDEYEALAVRLARNPEELAAIRARLAQNRLRKPLFDTQRSARNLERAYQQIWRLYLNGEEPKRIEVVES